MLRLAPGHMVDEPGPGWRPVHRQVEDSGCRIHIDQPLFQLEGDAVRRAIMREALSGLVNGILFAIGVGLVALVWFHDVKLSLVLATAMLATFLWAGFSGILVPLGLKKLGADPAVASSVFVLTLTDVMAFFSFLGLATLVLL